MYPQRINAHLNKICDKSSAVARQFVFSEQELEEKAVSLADPIGDDAHSPVRGIVHRYPDRVLLLTHFSCPSICRFCFRKTKIGKEPALSGSELEDALNYIRSHKEIFEVILSGGEPLQLSLKHLQSIVDDLEAIEHVAVIRIHTRLPLTAPKQAADFFQEKLRFSKPVYMVIHCNHPDEITPEWQKFVRDARDNGISLLSQSVLLGGVNDSVEELEKLFRELMKNGVKPYYLHHPDQVVGTDHFRVSLKHGRDIFNQLRGRLSGVAIPRYILDIPGGFGKVSAESEMVVEDGDGFVVAHGGGEVHYNSGN